ncbi:hypothetical protein LCGC14_0176400 [marine sediment metagenome]|uniref:Uncharacterized protein n=1 Tax=marine sediment metagenome TaxID=412755 RepID=A0A0F9X9Y0_9ZZZZ
MKDINRWKLIWTVLRPKNRGPANISNHENWGHTHMRIKHYYLRYKYIIKAIISIAFGMKKDYLFGDWEIIYYGGGGTPWMSGGYGSYWMQVDVSTTEWGYAHFSNSSE